MFTFNNTYQKLPATLFSPQPPEAVTSPELIAFNTGLADELGLRHSELSPQQIANYLSGNRLFTGSQPIAQAYAGHQFGSFTTLGDGRAILVGEQVSNNGELYDIVLKGAGPTPYSRNGDGRAALGPVIREYLISEAMHALAIPSTRSLAAVTTGETIYREQALPSAIITRVASSHIRVGTFEYLAAKQDNNALKHLTEFALKRHYSQSTDTENSALTLLNKVSEAQAWLIANWQRVGFIHGVMNTDNFTIGGFTLDYGPCAFLDEYIPDKVFSSIDHNGRYAFNNQAKIAQWNLARFAEALLPLIDSDIKQAVEKATVVIEQFYDHYNQAWLKLMTAKLGICNPTLADKNLIDALFQIMAEARLDFTNSFLQLQSQLDDKQLELDPALVTFNRNWQKQLIQHGISNDQALSLMQQSNPAIIPRNHRVEAVIEAAYQGDLAPFHSAIELFKKPYVNSADKADWQQPVTDADRVEQTFCGT